jgi:hypothetical protein
MISIERSQDESGYVLYIKKFLLTFQEAQINSSGKATSKAILEAVKKIQVVINSELDEIVSDLETVK